MSMVSEFKKFIMRGNAVDLAVGIIIGAAFGKIVTAMVDGILMPPLGWAISGISFSDLAITLKEPSDGGPGVRIKYGILIQAIIDFVIVGACLFLVIKGMNKLQSPPPEKPKETPDDIKLLTEIRDLLKAKG